MRLIQCAGHKLCQLKRTPFFLEAGTAQITGYFRQGWKWKPRGLPFYYSTESESEKMGKSLENKFRSANMGVHQIIYNAKDPYGQPVALLCFLLIKSHRIQAQPKGISELVETQAELRNKTNHEKIDFAVVYSTDRSLQSAHLNWNCNPGRAGVCNMWSGRKSGPGQRSTLCGRRENGKIMSTKVASSIKTSMNFLRNP